MFISYAREDSKFASRLAADLDNAGANVWLDQSGILIGKDWTQAVEEALASCGQFLVILSPASVGSPNVRDEVNFALDEKKRIFPVLYKRCKPPFRIRNAQYVDFTADYQTGLKALLEALTAGQVGKTGAQPPDRLKRLRFLVAVGSLVLLLSISWLFSRTRGTPRAVEAIIVDDFNDTLNRPSRSHWFAPPEWRLDGSPHDRLKVVGDQIGYLKAPGKPAIDTFFDYQTCFQVIVGDPPKGLVDEKGRSVRTVELLPVGTTAVLAPASGKSRKITSGAELDSVQSSRIVVYGERLLSLLPLKSFRDLDDLLMLAPGVALAPQRAGPDGPALAPGIGSAGRYAVNGLRSRENNFTVDGSDQNDEETGTRRQGFTAPYGQSVEGLQEVYITTAAADARFGRSMGAQIDALSKAGRQRLHGEVHGFGAADALRARNFFDHARSTQPVKLTTDGTQNGAPVYLSLDRSYPGPLTCDGGVGYQPNPLGAQAGQSRYQYGIAAGGRLKAHGPYFFGTFERSIESGRQQSNFSVPTVRQRGVANNGDAGQEIANVIPAYPVSLSGDAIFSLIPFPNNPHGPYGPNTYSSVLPSDARGYLYSAKFDQDFHTGQLDHSLTVRFNQNGEFKDLPAVGDAIFSAIRPHVGTSNISSFFNTRISRAYFNTFRFSFGATAIHFDPLPQGLLPSDRVTAGLDAPYLLNAPLLVNATLPMGYPTYITPASQGLTY
jgi:TIR domain